MRGILLATHGRGPADGAARVADALARKLGVSLRVLGVVEPLPVGDGGFGIPYFETPEAEGARRGALRAAIAEQLTRCSVSAPIEIVIGAPAHEIAAAARADGAALVVLGIGSHRLLDRALGNETALQLVQTASARVLAVAAAAITNPHHVLVAVDFSPTSTASAHTLADWMRDGDTFHLVHVARFGSDTANHASDRVRATTLLAKELEAMAANLCLRDGVTVRTSVLVGDPAAELLELASREDADLIATGSHGYGIWKRLTLGSVASKILRLANQSVLVTPIGSLASLHHPEVRYAAFTEPLSREEARIGTTL